VEWPLVPLDGRPVPEADEIGKTEPPVRLLVSRFTAPGSGELFLYVNDAIFAWPFGLLGSYFYDNNRGMAKVTVQREPLPKPAEGP
jgi:hypothetical protein